MSRVLVAVDESEGTRRAVEFVERFFAGPGFDLTAVNVARVPFTGLPTVPYGATMPWPWRLPGQPDREVVDQAMDREVTSAEAVAARTAPAGADVEVVVGDAVEAILDAAERDDADLIVVGSNDRGVLDRLLTGSVSTKLARKAPRPVLVVH